MNLLQEVLIALLSGLTTKNEDGSINWEDDKIYPLDIETQTYMIKWGNGAKFWYLNGNLHREGDLPAIEYSDGSKWWYINGKLHRENGPAVEYTNDVRYWWLNGKCYSEKEWRKKLNK